MNEHDKSKDGTYHDVASLKQLLSDAGAVFDRGKSPTTRPKLIEACLERGLITQEDLTAKRTRKDVSNKKIVKSKAIYSTVKCCLKSRLADKRDLDILEELVAYSSKLAVLGSLAFNQVLLYYLGDTHHLPDWMDFEDKAFAQTFIRNCFLRRKSNIYTNKVELAFVNKPLPTFDAPVGFGQAASWVSKGYLTNFKNHIDVNCKPEIEKLILRVCKRAGEEKGLWYKLAKCVLAPQVPSHEKYLLLAKEPMTLKVVIELREMVQARLKPFITKDNEEMYYIPLNGKLELMSWVQECNRYMKFKNFSIAPVHTVKRHFVTIDKTVYREFIFPRQKEVGIYKPEANIEGLENDHLWSMFTSLDKLKTKGWKIEKSIKTDSVSLCVSFTKEVPVVENEDTIEEDTRRPLYIGVDPGRVNIYTVVWYGDGRPKIMKLHRSRYFKEAGITESRAKKQRWVRPIQGLVQELSLTTKRTSSLAEFFRYSSTLMANYDKLWAILGAKRFSSDRMDLYINKARALDRFLGEMESRLRMDGIRAKTRRLVVSYGSAKFAPNSKGCPSVPTTTAYKRMNRMFETKLTNEHGTTKYGAFCFKELDDIHDMNGYVMRGSKCCRNNIDLELFNAGHHLSGARLTRDGTGVIVSRDGNAALNIRNLLARGVRPRVMTR
jgi:hypothetical protein